MEEMIFFKRVFNREGEIDDLQKEGRIVGNVFKQVRGDRIQVQWKSLKLIQGYGQFILKGKVEYKGIEVGRRGGGSLQNFFFDCFNFFRKVESMFIS